MKIGLQPEQFSFLPFEVYISFTSRIIEIAREWQNRALKPVYFMVWGTVLCLSYSKTGDISIYALQLRKQFTAQLLTLEKPEPNHKTGRSF